MISSQVPAESSYKTVLLRALLYKKFLSKLAKGTVYFLSTWMGKITRCHKTMFGMIVNRKTRRIEPLEKRFKNDKTKCDCSKCSKDMMDKKKRVISSDFLAALAYSHRVSNTKRLKNNGEDLLRNRVENRDGSSSSGIWENSRTNTKDVVNNDVGQAWWASVLERRQYMPPLQDSISKQTKSECRSDPSGFGSHLGTHLAIPSLSEKFINEESLVPKSTLTDCENLIHFQHRNGSKSEPSNFPWSLNRSLSSVDSCNRSRREGRAIVDKEFPKRLSFIQNLQRRREAIRSGKWAFERRWKAQENGPGIICAAQMSARFIPGPTCFEYI